MIQQGYSHSELMAMTEFEFMAEFEDAQNYNLLVKEEYERQAAESQDN